MSTDFKNKYNFLNDEFWQDFIAKNYKNPIDKLLFSLNQKLEVDSGILANQLKARQIIETKIPSWQNHKNLIFPKQLSMEQCSSEHTALYKSKICTGESCIDLTGGLGIDSYFLSKSFKNTIHCEKDLELQFIAQHNLECLHAKVESYPADGIECLKHTNLNFDLIYIDPSRRNENNTKVVRLEEYTPNIILHLNLLLKKGKQILVKTSPLLDIKQAMEKLPQLKEIHVIAVNNECKELLFLIDANSSKKQTSIICKDLVKDYTFKFDNEQELNSKINLSLPEKYIYEPNASILKAGAFKSIALSFDLSKLHANSHLYTSENYVKDFPGRCFELNTICRLNKKEIQTAIKSKKANISKRNFPNSVNEIRKKLGLNDGGNDYIFATTLMNEEKRLLICRKC